MRRVIERLPLIAFLAIFLPTCYVGATLLLLSGTWRRAYQLPDLTRRDVVIALVLLNVAPVLLCMAAETGFRSWSRRRSRRDTPPIVERGSPLLGWLVFLAALVVAAWSLSRADALNSFGVWASHETYVIERWRLFARLTFFEFVNLYTVLPLAGAYVIMVQKKPWTTLLVIALVGITQYPLAQRRVLLTSALLMGTALYVNHVVGREQGRTGPSRPVWPLLGAAMMLFGFYLILTLRWGHALAATNELMIRYAIPAILYSAFFPRILPYYHLDVGLDILGLGRMPDDNTRVQEAWVPGTGYTVQGPFQFVLYSQGGIMVALAGSVIIGALLGAAWAKVLEGGRLTATRSLLGALVISFGAFLAMDAPRNAVIVSYGLAWGALFVGCLHVAGRGWGAVKAKCHRPSMP